MVATTYEVFKGLFDLFWVLGTAVTVFVTAYILYYLVKNRATKGGAEEEFKVGEPPRSTGRGTKLAISVALSTIILTVLIFGTFGAVDYLDNPPSGTLDVKVIGYQWGWKFVYPNGYVSSGELRVPKGEVIRLWVTSEDVFHNFGIVDFYIKTDAIPGQVNLIWFKARETGEYLIQCFELCGVGHAFMVAKLIVMEPSEFEEWYSKVGKGVS